MKEAINIVGIHTFTIRDAETGEVKRRHTIKNIVVLAGRTVLARLLSGDATYSGEVNYGALGTGTTAPSNSQTQLVSESLRVPVTSQTYEDNIAYLSFFFPAGVAVNYEEFGNFIDGTASANSGQMFTRALVSGTKASNETLTIDTSYEIN